MEKFTFFRSEVDHFCSALSLGEPESWHRKKIDLYFCQHAVSLSVDCIFFCVSNIEKINSKRVLVMMRIWSFSHDEKAGFFFYYCGTLQQSKTHTAVMFPCSWMKSQSNIQCLYIKVNNL